MSTQLHRDRVKAVSIDGIRQKKMYERADAKIAVIGQGPDGFSLATLAASRGFETVAFDADEVKIAQLEAHSAKEPARNLSITSDESLLRNSDVFLLCAEPDGSSGLKPLEAAAAAAGRNLREGTLVIVESVVYPGVCEHVVLPMLEKYSGLTRPAPERPNAGFFFAHAPAARTHERQVIGASNAESLSRAAALYRAFGHEVARMRSIKEAEAVHLIEDSLRDAALALAGEFSILFDRIGVDIDNVLKAVRLESVDPASLSGIGVPRTSPSAYYLARSGHEHQIDQQFLSSARRIVEYMPTYATNVLAEVFHDRRLSLKDAAVAVLGISGGEESVGQRMRIALAKKGAAVRAYDPYITGAGVGLKETLEGAQAAVVASDHAMFRSLSPRQFEELGIAVVIDARNCLDKGAFEKSSVIYRGIGRG